MDCSPPSSSVRGILQARMVEWVAISYPIHIKEVAKGMIFKGKRVMGNVIMDNLVTVMNI